ncbi:unnamed protein product [Brachionus calyciflorus]|uniref:Ankyrin n=1 Tax=Brachionus calyciflorus TaxID=104777 RepID=A0A813NVE7_9BILA|nr:unnamed protein product [Brachionus calyciflorus]
MKEKHENLNKKYIEKKNSSSQNSFRNNPKKTTTNEKVNCVKPSILFNAIFNLLSSKERNLSTLIELNNLLNSNSNVSDILNSYDKNLDGSFLHYVTQTAQSGDDISWRIVYSLSNAGIDVNMQNSQGNTALHLAYMRGYTEIGFEFIEALLKIGTDLRIRNNNNKIAQKYMEDSEQLKCMYEAHYPGIWAAIDDSNTIDIQRLSNALVRLNLKKDGIKLEEYAYEKKISNKSELTLIFTRYSQAIDLVHSIYSIDFKRVDYLANLLGDKFDSNLADFSYCFTWFKPYCRNIPKFLLEIALETKHLDIIKLLLTAGSDVNLPNSKTGNPLYFHAFESDFKSLKNEFLSRANFNAKNQHGQNVLFYIVNLYLNENLTQEDRDDLLGDFRSILKTYSMLLTHRDQDESTLIEAILSTSPNNFKRLNVFMKEISNFLLRIFDEKNFRIFQDMFYQSYGLVLLNTPIYGDETETITFEEFINRNNFNEIKIYLKKIFDSDYLDNINNFVIAIKSGNLNGIKELLKNEKNYSLLRIRDYSGRSCLHLACLFSQSHIVKFLLQNDSNLIKAIDNLNRTALHYAYALKDKPIIDILISYNINKFARDAKFLLAEEYELDEVVNDSWFRVKNFRENETLNSRAVELFMMCFQYKDFKYAIETNDLETLNKLNSKLKMYELSINDFPLIKSKLFSKDTNSLLEIAMKAKSYSAFRFILERIYESISSKNGTKYNKIKTNFDLYIHELRERAEDLEMYEIIDIIDNTIEDKEIANITVNSFSDSNNYNSNNDVIIQNILAKKKLDSMSNNNNKQQKASKKSYLSFSNQSNDNEIDVSKSTKICSIL